ncbi:unnamed protein product [Vicia faba]|uniref:Uncharacterized protein n=1 Tax=Vicia faba TaxID=3906 RepID=A0AAV0ZQU6_VICFA|nr:unnamed protein product [Vicia faba]
MLIMLLTQFLLIPFIAISQCFTPFFSHAVWLTLSEGDSVVQKIPYNKNKSNVGSIVMTSAGYFGVLMAYGGLQEVSRFQLLLKFLSYKEYIKSLHDVKTMQVKAKHVTSTKFLDRVENFAGWLR